MTISKFIGLFVLFFFNTTLVLAEPAVIRSGEHGSFTRLVINSKNLGPWRLVGSKETYRIQFSSFNQGFDIDSIFSRIDRERVRKVTVQESEIELELACSCLVDVSSGGADLVIIDVSDNPSTPVTLPNQTTTNLKPSTLILPFSFERNAHIDRYFSEDISQPFNFLNVENKKNSTSNLLPSVERKPNDTEVIPITSALQETLIDNLQSQLQGGFGTASTRGILSANVELSEEQAIGPFSEYQNNTDFSSNFLIRGNMNKSAFSQNDRAEEHSSEDCKPNSRMQISEWSDGRSFDQQLGDANLNLYTTLGKINPQGAAKLARIYLHFGFGVEAKQIMYSEPTLRQIFPELILIANILEYGSVEFSAFFEKRSACNGPLLFWSTFSKTKENSDLLEQKEEILLQLSTLPIHLRRILAPTISARFLKAGSSALAMSALQTLKRTEYTLNDDAELEEAIILRANDYPKKALEKVSNIQTNSYIAAEALVQEIGLKLAAGLETDDKTFELINGYATEFEDTPVEIELQKVAILAMSQAGQFTQAFEKSEKIGLAAQSEVLTLVYKDLVSSASDTTFSEQVFKAIDRKFLGQDSYLNLQFSQRLFELGFYNEAEKYLLSANQRIPVEQYQLLNAKIAIALDRPVAAEAFLTNLTSQDASELRAQIKSIEGNYKEAAEIYRNTNNSSMERRNAWLSKDWDEMFFDDESTIGVLSKMAQTDVTVTSNPIGMLDRVGKLIEESHSSRKVLADAITKPPVALEERE